MVLLSSVLNHVDDLVSKLCSSSSLGAVKWSLRSFMYFILTLFSIFQLVWYPTLSSLGAYSQVPMRRQVIRVYFCDFINIHSFRRAVWRCSTTCGSPLYFSSIFSHSIPESPEHDRFLLWNYCRNSLSISQFWTQHKKNILDLMKRLWDYRTSVNFCSNGLVYHNSFSWEQRRSRSSIHIWELLNCKERTKPNQMDDL